MSVFVTRKPAGGGGGGSTAYSETIGDGTATSFTITHNLGTRDIVGVVRQVASPYEQVYASDIIKAATTNTATIDFGAGNAPTSNQFRVTIWK